jgi:hypothetical protein
MGGKLDHSSRMTDHGTAISFEKRGFEVGLKDVYRGC